ncbi:MAG: DUF2865 domain-containing protein, partial [Pseudomonadota bacterium]
MCVRTCDGYYWPLGTNVPSWRFARARRACDSRCTSPTELFVLRGGNLELEQMRDVNGRAYSKMPNAFAYRKERKASCYCKPDPWSEAAWRRHVELARIETAALQKARASQEARERATAKRKAKAREAAARREARIEIARTAWRERARRRAGFSQPVAPPVRAAFLRARYAYAQTLQENGAAGVTTDRLSGGEA